MKKTNNKTKSPTPATSTPKSARKKAPVPSKAAAAPAVSTPAPVMPAPAAPAPAFATQEKVAVNAVAPAPVKTRIVAQLDVGFGNALYIRGNGPGLSWDQGTPMECVSSDQWELVVGESSRPISFKVLLNDRIWCTGPDSVAASGSTTTIVPEFA